MTDLIAEVLIVSLAEFKRDLPPTLLETMLKPLLETVDEPDDDDEAVFSSKFLIASRVCRAPRLQIALEEVHTFSPNWACFLVTNMIPLLVSLVSTPIR